MIAVSGALVFAGYQLLAYGWSQIRGSNAGFFEILWPGRFAPVASDGPAAAAPPGTSGAAALGSGTGSVSKTFPGGSTGATTILGK